MEYFAISFLLFLSRWMHKQGRFCEPISTANVLRSLLRSSERVRCMHVCAKARTRAWKCLSFVDRTQYRRSFAHALQVHMRAFTFLHICTSQCAASTMIVMSPRINKTSCAITKPHVKTWEDRATHCPSSLSFYLRRKLVRPSSLFRICVLFRFLFSAHSHSARPQTRISFSYKLSSWKSYGAQDYY